MRRTQRCMMYACFALTYLCMASCFSADKPVCPQAISLGFYDAGLLYDEATGRGVDRDVIDELARRTGCQFAEKVYPRARIWHMLESGELAMSVSGIQTPERDKFAHFALYLSVKNVVLLQKRTSKEIRTWAEFMADKRLKIGVVRGFKHSLFYDQQLRLLQEQNRVVEVASLPLLFSNFKNGEWAAIISHPQFYGVHLDKHQRLPFATIHDWAPQEPGVKGGLILARQHFSDAEASKWQKILKDMRTDGTMYRILRQYFSKEDTARLLK